MNAEYDCAIKKSEMYRGANDFVDMAMMNPIYEIRTVSMLTLAAAGPNITYDSDANPDARDFFVNQATPQGIAQTLMDEAARLTDGEGEFAIITASLTAANMNEWRKNIEARLAEKYPKMKLVDTKPCDDLKDKAQAEATNLLSANPNLKLIMAICIGVLGRLEPPA